MSLILKDFFSYLLPLSSKTLKKAKKKQYFDSLLKCIKRLRKKLKKKKRNQFFRQSVKDHINHTKERLFNYTHTTTGSLRMVTKKTLVHAQKYFSTEELL